jgi:hypothetical protein
MSIISGVVAVEMPVLWTFMDHSIWYEQFTANGFFCFFFVFLLLISLQNDMEVLLALIMRMIVR